MSKSVTAISLLLILLTAFYLIYVLVHEPSRWQFLAIAACHFIMAAIASKQLTLKKYNYLSIIHLTCMFAFSSIGFIFL